MTTSSDVSREYSERVCAWCRGPIRAGSRRDAITCSTSCRQARNRFVQGVGTPPPSAGGPPLRLAYADPPYPGMAGYYRDHPDYAGEVDHAELISRLASTYDGWALSTSSAALRELLPLCPQGVRVAAWHRGERPARSRGPQSAWEPVIYAGGRLAIESRAVVARDASAIAARHVSRPPTTAVHLVDATGSGSARDESPVDELQLAPIKDASHLEARRIDSLIYRPGVRTTDPARVIGAKPAVFIRWVFDLLGALPGDELVDIFPGSGGVGRAWQIYAEAGA